MLKKKGVFVFAIVAVVLLSLFAFGRGKDSYKAATSYTNAKEFYESTALKGEPYHSESWNGAIYYATYAKLASSNVGTISTPLPAHRPSALST